MRKQFVIQAPLDPETEVFVAVTIENFGCCLGRGKLGEEIALGYKNDKRPGEWDVSPARLEDVGCEWVILGHCRRLGQSDALIGQNVKFCLENGLKVLICIGERLEDRNFLKTLKFLALERIVRYFGPDHAMVEQMELPWNVKIELQSKIEEMWFARLKTIADTDWPRVVLAYEPGREGPPRRSTPRGSTPR